MGVVQIAPRQGGMTAVPGDGYDFSPMTILTRFSEISATGCFPSPSCRRYTTSIWSAWGGEEAELGIGPWW